MLASRSGVKVHFLPVDGEGRIIVQALPPRTKLVSLAHVSNVTGAVLDVAAIVAEAKRVGAHACCSTARSARRTGPIDVPALGVDFYAFSGHKTFAPHGVGVLWAKIRIARRDAALSGRRRDDRSASRPQGFTARQSAREIRGGHAADLRRDRLRRGLRMARHARLGGDRGEHELRMTGRLLDGLRAVDGVTVIGPQGLARPAPPSCRSIWPTRIRTIFARSWIGMVLLCAAGIIARSRCMRNSISPARRVRRSPSIARTKISICFSPASPTPSAC